MNFIFKWKKHVHVATMMITLSPIGFPFLKAETHAKCTNISTNLDSKLHDTKGEQNLRRLIDPLSANVSFNKYLMEWSSFV